MKNWKNNILVIMIAVAGFTPFSASSQEVASNVLAKDSVVSSVPLTPLTPATKVEKQDSVSSTTELTKVTSANPVSQQDMRDYVIIKGDTINMVMPEKNLGRFDRGLLNFLFIPRGQWTFGLTASYGEFNVGDMQLLNLLKDFDFKGSIFSIKPYVAYLFKNNHAIGMKIGYTKNSANLNGLKMDFGDDLNFDISGVVFKDESYSASLFYRHYIGLDRSKRFGFFNEIDLTFANGLGSFKRNYDGKPRETITNTTEVSLNFSPGICVFIQDYISFNVSFGIFGLYLKDEKQKTDNVDEGSRFTSGADFRFNLFNINFGIAVHI